MVYTTSPWSVTCTVTMTWGEAGTEPEAISEVRATPAAGGQALVFPVSEEEAAAQRTAFSEGVLTDTEYTLELYAGKKMRGTCTHRTVPGPVPALYASAQLDFTTDPVSASAEIRWELYYVSPEELSEIVLTRKGVETPERQVPVTPADIAAGSATVTALAPGAEYTAALKSRDGKTIASSEFTTPEAPGQDVIVVRPGDDLAAIISAPDRQYETVYLVAGEYTVTADAAIPIARNLELYSDDPARTTISITKNFQPEGTLEQIILRNLRIECSTYLMQARSDYDIALLRIDNCIVDLNSGATGASTLFNTTKGTATKQMLHQYEVVNSIVFSNAGQTQNIVYGSASGSIGEFEKIVMRHSTFSNCARGLIYVTNTADCAYEIELENCTLYNVASAGSNALIDIRMAGTANASGRRIALRNSVMWFGSTKGYQVLRFAGSGEGQYVPKEQIDCANFYHFASQTPAFGSSAYNVADRMTPYNGAPADPVAEPHGRPLGGRSLVPHQGPVGARRAGSRRNHTRRPPLGIIRPDDETDPSHSRHLPARRLYGRRAAVRRPAERLAQRRNRLRSHRRDDRAAGGVPACHGRRAALRLRDLAAGGLLPLARTHRARSRALPRPIRRLRPRQPGRPDRKARWSSH